MVQSLIFEATGMNSLVHNIKGPVRAALWCVVAHASISTTLAANCSTQYWQGQPPVVVNTTLNKQTRPLCFDGFAVMHSGVTRTPLWVAEYLTATRLKKARDLDRQDSFHEEEQLPESERATLSDYRSSGYDRGHMAPNGDMASRQQQSDSFSLANMVPQSPTNNREVWRNLEEATRALVVQEGEGYVVTGPAFLGQTLKRTKRVFVPTHVYKVVYFPKRQAVSAYWAPNDESGRVEVISLADLEQKIGITVLPHLSDRVRQHRVDLPISVSQVSKNSLGKTNEHVEHPPTTPRASSPTQSSSQDDHAINWPHLIQLIVKLFFK
jgi:endonuclease G